MLQTQGPRQLSCRDWEWDRDCERHARCERDRDCARHARYTGRWDGPLHRQGVPLIGLQLACNARVANAMAPVACLRVEGHARLPVLLALIARPLDGVDGGAAAVLGAHDALMTAARAWSAPLAGLLVLAARGASPQQDVDMGSGSTDGVEGRTTLRAARDANKW